MVHLAENAGTGFTKMIRSWQIYRGQALVFLQEIDYTLVAFWLTSDADQPSKISPETSSKTCVLNGVKRSKAGGKKSGEKGGTKGSTKHAKAFGANGGARIALTKRQRELYDILHDNNSLSIDEVAIIF